MDGWIKLHRIIQNNDIWNSEPFSRGQAWVDLLLLANHKESFFYKRGNKVTVKRGQVGRSEVELSDRWKWSRTKVRKFLKDLEKEQQIIIHKSRVTQLLTIVNYDVYQEKEQQTGQQKDNRKTTEEQQKDTYKNEKKEKNDNNEKNKKSVEAHTQEIEILQAEKQKLAKELEDLKKQKSEAQKEERKSSAKKKETGKHEFPDLAGQKVYNPKDKRPNKQLPFDIVTARATIDALYPTWQDLEQEYNNVFSEPATKEIFEKCLKTFVEEGISRYYQGIRSIDKLVVKILEWVRKEVKFSRNDQQTDKKPISQNSLFLKGDLSGRNVWDKN